MKITVVEPLPRIRNRELVVGMAHTGPQNVDKTTINTCFVDRFFEITPVNSKDDIDIAAELEKDLFFIVFDNDYFTVHRKNFKGITDSINCDYQ
jgi:hypothetical protein